MKGHCLLKLLQFCEHLSGFQGGKDPTDLSYWNEFVHRFFSPRAVFRFVVHEYGDDGVAADKPYELGFPILARYFNSYFQGGATNIQLVLDKGTTDKPLTGDSHFIENTKASMHFWYPGNLMVMASGTLRAHFDGEQKIELLEFQQNHYEEFLPRSLVLQGAKPTHTWIKDWKQANNDAKASPEMSKKSKQRQFKSPQSVPPDLELPDALVNKNGLSAAVQNFLEISEILSHMNPLFSHAHMHPNLGPYAALNSYIQTVSGQGDNAGVMNGQPMPQGAGGQPRTPSYGQFPMGASPHAANLQLPGSPHIGSPAMAQQMVPQQSQQGTSSSGPSANTSPAGTKRRRPSGVKTEDDGTPVSAPTPGSGPLVNGIQAGKGKPPTPRMQKRLKTGPQAQS